MSTVLDVEIPIICETDGCRNFGFRINTIFMAKKDLELFMEAYGHGGEEPEDICPLCGKLGVAEA